MRLATALPLPAAGAGALALLLAACASHGPPPPGYAQEVEQLRAACEARGGMLIPSGRISGNAAIDYPCRIHEATTLPPRP